MTSHPATALARRSSVGDTPAVKAATRRTAALLSAGVPLTLLMDLARPGGPRSEELLELERYGA